MNTGSALARFTITLSQAVTEPVQVEWFTSDGTAKAGVDYAANKGTVLFAPGETSKTVDILVYGRAVGSEDRSFYVEMLPPTNAILGASIGECIITVDTSGSTPVTQIIVPTGPQGDQGDSAYQSYLNTTTDNPPMTEAEWVDSLKGDPAEIAQEVAPLIDVGATTLVAEGTDTLGHPDSTTVKAVARRIAYSPAAKIATMTLADGDNTIDESNLTGDSISFLSSGMVPRVLHGSTMSEPEWGMTASGELIVYNATAGDVLYLIQYETVSVNMPLERSWFNRLKSFETGRTLSSEKDAILWESSPNGKDDYYIWLGAKPKVVPAGSTPLTTGGVGPEAWFRIKDGGWHSWLTETRKRAGLVAAFDGNKPEDKLRNAIIYGNENDVDIDCAGLGDFSITGSDDIILNNIGIDFAGVTVDLSQWSGKFIIQDSNGYEVFSASSPLVQALVAQGVQSGAKLKGWDSLTDADDSYLRIMTSQAFFTYRGTTVNREEYNKHSRFGMLNSTLRYDLDPTKITEIRALKIAKKWKTFGNVSFSLRGRDLPSQPEVVHIQYASLVNLINIRFTMDNMTYVNGNPVLISLWDSCHLNLDNIYCQWPLYAETEGVATYTYDININLCYDVTLNRCDGIGDGWGATGNNSSQLIHIRNSKLSRIDFHQPFRELLQITDTKIGDSGIALTAIGDLVIDGDSEFLRSDRKSGISGGYITARSDANGFCDGKLIMRGTRFTFDSESPHYLLRQFGDINQPKPAGSPINYTFFDTIDLQGLRNNYGGTLALEPHVQSGIGVTYPSTMIIKDCVDGNFEFKALLNSSLPAGGAVNDSLRNTATRSNFNVVMDNVKLLYTSRFELVDTAANNFRINLSMNRVYGSKGGKGISMLMNFAGVICASNCELESFDSLTGGGLTKYLDVMIDNSEISYQGRFSQYIINGYAQGKSNIKVSNSLISLPTEADVQTSTLIQCRLIGNSYITPSGQSDMLKLQSTGQTVTVPVAVNVANNYVLEMNGNNKWAPFRIPQAVNEVSYIQQSSSTWASVTRNATTTLFMSGSSVAPSAVYVS